MFFNKWEAFRPSGERRMRKLLAVTVIISFTANACMPSLQYRLGQGFWSDSFAKMQVQAAANAGKVKNLGRFSIDSFACFNYSQDLADEHIVIPAIRQKLRELGANVADNVVANEKWYDVFLFIGLLYVPIILGCSNWQISGEALLVEQGVMNSLQKMLGHQENEDILIIFTRS